MPGQREVEISHDVTFDEDVALGKISNLPIPMKDKEADIGKQGEMQDESMPNAKNQWIPLIHLHTSPPPLKGDPHGLGKLSKMLRNMLHLGGHFMKARSQICTKGT